MSNDVHIEGAWAFQDYVVAGTVIPVEGILVLAEGRWATVYVVDPDGDRPGGNGEAGEYVRDGDVLTFTHRHTVEAGAGRNLAIIPRNCRVEECRVTCDARSMTIRFPSGSVLRLVRVSRP